MNSEMREKILSIRDRIRKSALASGRNPECIRLIAVSKKKSPEMVMEAIEAGQYVFGENYIQEAISKIEQMQKNSPEWHFIGHLQKNKSKFAVRYFDLIHTVDSEALALEIAKNAVKACKIQEILIQVKTGDELTKSGVELDNVMETVKKIAAIENVRIKGLMTIPPPVENPEDARPFFKALRKKAEEIKSENIAGVSMEELSMGMSDDFEVAVSEGATLVRIGTAIFGERN